MEERSMTNKSDNTALKRIEQLLDEHSFVELGALVTSRNTDFDLKQQDTPSDGVVIGHGLIDGNLVFVYSQDASVLNGTIGEMHAKKIATLYDMAIKTGAPVIGIIDCGGLRLQEATDVAVFTEALKTPNSVTAGDSKAYDLIVKANTQLNKNKVPKSDRFIVINAEVLEDLQ